MIPIEIRIRFIHHAPCCGSAQTAYRSCIIAHQLTCRWFTQTVDSGFLPNFPKALNVPNGRRIQTDKT